jgi:hypothetical protein
MTNMIDIKNKIISPTITVMLLLSVMIISSNFNYSQSAAAQNASANTVGTFNASGYTGQTFVLPGLIPTPNQQVPPVGSIVGGNWSFAVNGGKLQDFKWIGQAYTLTGKVNETLSVNGMTNASNFNILEPSSSGPIKLVGNSTTFKGNVNININGKTVWNDIPAIVTLSNGKLTAFQISHEETNGAFTIPLFGVVTSLTH